MTKREAQRVLTEMRVEKFIWLVLIGIDGQWSAKGEDAAGQMVIISSPAQWAEYKAALSA